MAQEVGGLQGGRSQRNVAGLALTTAALFLALVAVMLNAPALFYMGTALFALIGGCQIQALLAVRKLRFDRIVPESVHVGEQVTVEVVVWSERKIRRPLVTLVDSLPTRMRAEDVTLSLPVAPAYDLPVRTRYSFRPGKRGRFRWSGVTVEGTDALGLITKRKHYVTQIAEMLVLPEPKPMAIPMTMFGSWGAGDADTGRSKGAGSEFAGIREYAAGDPMRSIHWRSSARQGKLTVKETMGGSNSLLTMLIQDTEGTEIGDERHSSLEEMVSNASWLVHRLLDDGVRVAFADQDGADLSVQSQELERRINEELSRVAADRKEPLGARLRDLVSQGAVGDALLLFLAVPEEGLVPELARLISRGVSVTVLLYDANAFTLKKKRGQAVKMIEVNAFEAELRRAGVRVVPVGASA